MNRRVLVGVGAVLVVALLAAGVVAASTRDPGPAELVVASTTTTQATALPASTIALPPTTADLVVPAAGGGSGPVFTLKASDGRAYATAIPFTSSVAVPAGLQFVLVIGSDARPGQDVRRANGDSVHLVAVNPATMEGTIVGIPRDAWVEIPGRGNGKLTSTLANGGPALVVDTVRRLTGLPVNYYVITGFQGLTAMVDAVGGVDVLVNRRMADRNSGAFFEPGWHHLNGAQALAFTRNRHDTASGDFGRSENHGSLLLAALGKLRAEVGDDGGLRRWMDVLGRHASLDVAPDKLLPLSVLARRIDPARMRNVVVPGRIGMAGRASVVFLTSEAAGLFADLRDDAVVGGPAGPPAAAPPAGGTAPAGPSGTDTTAPATTTPPAEPTSTTTAPDGLLPPLVPGG
jgi:polyisoprenyl-teichoic acid--peptidoglycan teichoic acid transferase